MGKCVVRGRHFSSFKFQVSWRKNEEISEWKAKNSEIRDNRINNYSLDGLKVGWNREIV